MFEIGTKVRGSEAENSDVTASYTHTVAFATIVNFQRNLEFPARGGSEGRKEIRG
jgi:hypothetical protein